MRNYQQVKDAIANYVSEGHNTSVRKIQDMLLTQGLRATQVEISVILQKIKEDEKNKVQYRRDMERK